MKLLFISQHYRPEPCDTRTSKLAEGLAAMGHHATALTSFPNYPFGRVYDGYRQKLCDRQEINGVHVVRVPMIPDHSRSKKRRAISYLSFGASAFILGALFTRRPDLIWIHHPPLTTGIAGYLLAKVKRVPFVYEVHDLWPETLVSTGMIREGRVTRAIRKVSRFLYQRAAFIVVTSHGMKNHLERQNVDPEKIVSIPQWADDSAFRPVDQDLEFALAHGLVGKRTVVFAGNLGIAQGMDTILDAAVRLTDIKDFQFVIIGDGVEMDRLRTRCERDGIDNVLFVGQQTSETVAKYLAWAEAGLIHLKDDPLFAITIPSKTQAYMACRVPILCGVAGDGADAVEEADCGFCFKPECDEELSVKIRALLMLRPSRKAEMANNAYAYYERHFKKERILQIYEDVFCGLLGKTPSFRATESGVERRAA